MIIRVVRMEFKPEEVDRFRDVFDNSKKLIRNFPGCKHLELYRDTSQPNVYYTYSHWETAEDLENYRHSHIFTETWGKTKPLFQGKPLAYSMHEIEEVN